MWCCLGCDHFVVATVVVGETRLTALALLCAIAFWSLFYNPCLVPELAFGCFIRFR